MNIVGGTYSEICFEPIWEHIFGSGFRAVSLLMDLSIDQPITFHTCADIEIEQHLRYCENLNPNLSIEVTEIFKSPEFHYDHPLQTPTISPRPDLYGEANITLKASGENMLVYGLLEAHILVEGQKVVYDPQSPANPIPFSKTGSKAQQLITVINRSEARKITGSNDIDTIREFFFSNEKCFALILKMGAQGALLFESKDSKPISIPVFKTDRVWPIGSGDIYSAIFAHNWFKGLDLKTSALLASKVTAIYCNSRSLSISEQLSSFSFPELIINSTPSSQIYLAGPFFTFSDRWLINEIRNILKGFGLKVFSPFHDVGHGKAQDVVDKDLDGLDKSKIVFAVIDGLDSGTLFEVGYAIAQGKKVIAFVQNENEESLKMLEGSGCIIEKDLTTAVYRTYWEIES